MTRSLRLLDIIQLLRRAKAPMTARTIAQELEVTPRTIYRDVVALQAMRVPIEGAAGVGYVMRAGLDVPPLMFTADELEAIAVGLSLLGRTRDGGLQAAAGRVTRKIADVLQPDGARHIEAAGLAVSPWTAVPKPDVDLSLLRRAIREERKLCFRYRDAATASTERTVRPIALTYYVDSVVLAAWCELRGDFRHFRPDRMEDCREEGDGFRGEGGRLRAAWQAAQTVV